MSTERSVPAHVQAAAIVLEDARLIYVPTPRAGSTAVLWGLLELTDLDPAAFRHSTKLETTRALTIHDASIWGSAYRLDPRRRDPRELFAAKDWLSFTVVRDPIRRIWSAWVAKILVRDPRFVRQYGAESWFPEPPRTPDDVVRSFRAFVAALPVRPAEWHDPHWSSQVELVGADVLPYDLVARVEQLPHDLEPVTRHLRRHGRDALRLRRENASLLPFTAELLDTEGWEACVAFTAGDCDAFGYAVPEGTAGPPLDVWVAKAEERLPGIQAAIERNERIGDLKELLAGRCMP